MKARTVVILVLVLLAAVLVIQNSQMTELRLTFWTIYAPLFVLVLIVFVLGLTVGYLAARRGRREDDRAAARRAPETPPVRPPSKP